MFAGWGWTQSCFWRLRVGEGGKQREDQKTQSRSEKITGNENPLQNSNKSQ